MIIPVGYAHVQHFFTGLAAPNGAAVTYGIQLAGATGGATRAIELHDAFGDAFMPEVTSQLTLSETHVKYGPNSVGPTYVFAGPVNGSNGGPPAPPNTAFLLEKKAALGGRKNRGRMFLPGVDGDEFSPGGVISSGRFGTLTAAAANFLDALETLESPMVILHSASSDPSTVTELLLDPVLATQRRRLR
jgi:hypothetical protein